MKSDKKDLINRAFELTYAEELSGNEIIELEILVAKIAGYYVESQVFDENPTIYHLYTPHHSPVISDMISYSEEEAWENVPSFLYDMNACIQLFLDMDYKERWAINYEPSYDNNPEVIIEDRDEVNKYVYLSKTRTVSSIATAMIRAWIDRVHFKGDK